MSRELARRLGLLGIAASAVMVGSDLILLYVPVGAAGYHFFVAEALFLTSQFEALLDWVEFTENEFPELAYLEQNVFNELLRAFAVVALLRTGRILVRGLSVRHL